MDPNFGQTPGMDLSQPAAGQGTISGGMPQGQAQMPSQAVSPTDVTEESASDDELDREWVNKAKDIVEQTKSDPFAQSNELNRVKASYLKARFNKDLNVGDGSS